MAEDTADTKGLAWYLEGDPPKTPTTPDKSGKQDDNKRAHLEVIKPTSYKPSTIPLCFNPTEYQLSKQNTFHEVPIPGLNASPIQFVRGTSEKLTFDAIVDTSDDMSNVRQKYVDPIRKLATTNKEIHAPPVVKFVWETFSFTGVIEALNVTFTLFSDSGVPVRAKLNITLKEYTTVQEQKTLGEKNSPDLERTYVVRRGDTLSAIAAQSYGDPTHWREIATANGISDPRTLDPGLVLTIPRLGGTS
jgi:LysM repeat protein